MEDSDSWDDDSDLEELYNNNGHISNFKLWRPPPFRLFDIKDKIEVVNTEPRESDNWEVVKKSRGHRRRKSFIVVNSDLSYSKIQWEDDIKKVQNDVDKSCNKACLKICNDTCPVESSLNGKNPDLGYICNQAPIGTFEFYKEPNLNADPNCSESQCVKKQKNLNIPQKFSDNKINSATAKTKKHILCIKKHNKKYKKESCLNITGPNNIKNLYEKNKDEHSLSKVVKTILDAQESYCETTRKLEIKKSSTDKKKSLKHSSMDVSTKVHHYAAIAFLVYIFYILVSFRLITVVIKMLIKNILTLVVVMRELILLLLAIYFTAMVVSSLFGLKLKRVYVPKCKKEVQTCVVFSPSSRRIYNFRKRS